MDKEKLFTESDMMDIYFTTPEMKRVFSDGNRVQRQMDCESALAAVEGDMGIIPADAAAEIINKSNVELVDFDKLKADFIRTGHPFIPLVHAYKDICDGTAGEFVHWGATTQDILDTAMTLQLREAYDILLKEYEALYRVVADKAYEYKDQVMVGRTNGQQALPITLGYKMSVWGFEIRENIDRLQECKKRVFKGLFAGAVGTLAALGDDGLEIQKRMVEKLGLTVPDVAWSTSRNHLAELANNVALMTSTISKIGNEFYALQKSEIDELEESQGAGAVGSSTMPHKRNPFRAMELGAFAKLVRGCANNMMNCLELEHERDPRSAQDEAEIFKQMFSVAHAAAVRATKLVANMVVRADHMERNLWVLNGLIFTEALMMTLGKKMGRQSAHDILHELSMKAYAENTNIDVLLKKDPRVDGMITAEEIDEIMQPAKYVGKSALFAENLKKQADAYFAAK